MPELLTVLSPESWMAVGLLALFLLSFVGSGPIPVPLTVTVLWLSQFHFPVGVVLASTAGTFAGWLCLERWLRRWLLQKPQWAERVPVSYQRFFLRRTGFWLFVLNALPFPLDFIRFLALLNGYNRVRLLWVLTVARLIRNTLLVTMGRALFQHQELFWAALIGFLILPFVLGRFLQTHPLEDKTASTPADTQDFRQTSA